MKQILRNRPWLYIVLAFFLLIGAWTSLIIVAVKNKPATIDLRHNAP